MPSTSSCLSRITRNAGHVKEYFSESRAPLYTNTHGRCSLKSIVVAAVKRYESNRWAKSDIELPTAARPHLQLILDA